MNVIWVVSDTLRRDHVGAYGNKTIHTPSIDALAVKSVRFDRHYIAGFPTMPTRADHMTGRWTMSYMQWEPLPKDEVTIAQILSKKGFHTAAVVDTPFYIRNEMNFDRGFRTFIEVPNQLQWIQETYHGQKGAEIFAPNRPDEECFAPRTFTKAMKWLGNHYKENFFLYIDTWDPHENWDAPWYYTERYWPGYDGKYARALYGYWPTVPGFTEENVKKAHAAYCGEVTMVDTWFGYLMRRVENMGLLENTAIIFTSDHGFQFGEHGGFFGKMIFAIDPKTGDQIPTVWGHSLFYGEVTHIPLFIYVPGVKPGSYNGLTSAVDLMPTVLDIIGQQIPGRVEGKSLLPMVHDNSVSGREYVVSAHPFINAQDQLASVDGLIRVTEKASTATVTTDECSLLYTIDPGLSELYNLKLDPKQEKNVIASHPDKAKELHQLLVKFMRETNMSKRLMEPRLKLLL
jgi:arylsulfatase A-like enzyme